MIETAFSTPLAESSPPSSPDGIRVSESLAPRRENSVAVATETSFDGLLEVPLYLREDLQDGCGGQVWPAGMALAKYLLRCHVNDLSNKTMWVLLPGLALRRFTDSLAVWNLEPEEDLLDSRWHVDATLNTPSISQTKKPCFP